MRKVNIDTLKPGMVLAEDLFHANGRLLLTKGLTLDPNHLRVLKVWGVAARMIASYKHIANTERLFIAGLLHDIGRIIIYKHLPEHGREMFLHAQRTNSFLRVADLEVVGFDHTQIGARLTQNWKLPVILQ